MKAVKNEVGLYQIEIDGKVYEFAKWGADDSLDAMIEIAGIVGGPLGEIISTVVTNGGLDGEFDPSAIINGVENLAKNLVLNKTASKALIKKLASDNVMCDGMKIIFNEHYRDSLAHLFKVVKASIEVQYGNFFKDLLSLLPAQKPVAKMPRKAQK